MNESRQTRDLVLILSCFLSSVLRRWKVILTAMLFCAICYDSLQWILYHPQYAASAQISMNNGDTTYSQLEQTQTYLKTLNYMMNGQSAHSYVNENMKEDDVDYTCSLIGSSNSNLATIEVKADSRREAWFALQYLLQWYEEKGETYHLDYDMNIIQVQPINDQPVYVINHVRNFIVGGCAGALLTIVLLIGWEYFHPTVRTPNEISYRIDCRMLAKLPKERKRKNMHLRKRKKEALLITSLKTSFRYKEAIKKLRSRIEESSKKHGYQTIMVTSVLENEGKSSVAVNLAIALAKSDYKVLMIDGDIRKPSLHRILELDTNRCLNQFLQESDSSWQDKVEHIKRIGIDVICAEPDIEHAEDLLGSEKMRQLLQEVKSCYDFIIVDCSPSAGMSDSRIVSEQCDAALLVIRQNMATVKSINEIIDRLVSVKNNLIGCIYNGNVYDFMSEQKAYGYRYRYNRYSAAGRR